MCGNRPIPGIPLQLTTGVIPAVYPNPRTYAVWAACVFCASYLLIPEMYNHLRY